MCIRDSRSRRPQVRFLARAPEPPTSHLLVDSESPHPDRFCTASPESPDGRAPLTGEEPLTGKSPTGTLRWGPRPVRLLVVVPRLRDTGEQAPDLGLAVAPVPAERADRRQLAGLRPPGHGLG